MSLLIRKPDSFWHPGLFCKIYYSLKEFGSYSFDPRTQWALSCQHHLYQINSLNPGFLARNEDLSGESQSQDGETLSCS